MATASPKAKFDAAVKVIHSLPKDGPFQPSREMMLTFYGYYKQATLGPCTTPKPSFWDLVNKAKWEAWSKLGDMDKETAMLNYVEELKKTLKDGTKQWDEMSKNGDPRIIEAMPQTQVVGDFVQVLGSFYEIVDEDSPIKSRTVPNGVPLDESDAVPFDENDAVLNGLPLDDGYNTEISTTDTSTEHDLEAHRLLEGSNPPDRNNSLPPEDSRQPEGRRGFSTGETTQSEDNGVPSSDSEEEFCDTSADLEILQAHVGHLSQQNGPIYQTQNVVPAVKSVKVNHVRFADDNDSRVHLETSETIHVAQGFPFISSESVPSAEEVMFETSRPLNTSIGAGRINGDVRMELRRTDISSNNSNFEEPVDEGEEPPDRGGNGDKGKDKDKKSDQGGRRTGSSRTNLQGGGGRRALLSGGGAGGGAGGGEQDQSEGQDGAVSEQIAVILVRLQQDMANVLERLNRLEVQSGRRKNEEKPEGRSVFNWWPFSSRTGRSAFFFLIWPIIVHLLLTYLFRRRRKR